MTLKRILLIVLLPVFLVFVVQTADAQSKGQKNKETSAPQSKYLLSILNYNAYCTGDMEPYIEFQFIIDGRTTKYVPDGDLFISEVDVRVDIVKKGENGKDEKVNGLHYILQSPHVRDSVVTEKSYFSDIQNVKIANGEYFLYFYLKDIHGTTDTIKYIDYLEVHFPEDRVSVSGISLWESMNASGEGGVFFKYGYALTPLFQQYAPEQIYALPFTIEIYNTDKVLGNQKQFIVKAAINEIGRRPNPELTVYKQLATAPVTLFFHKFNIYKLASGNYNLSVFVMDLDSNVVAESTIFFQRSNPSVKFDIANYDNVITKETFVEKYTDIKELQDYVACLYPIADNLEKEFLNQRMKKIPLEQLQRYFYSFWVDRAPNDPEEAWRQYKFKVDYVEKTYGSPVMKGYRTDRGRVYLKYGPPNNITEEPYDPQSYPYEIWHYYEIAGQTNIKFIFYNKDVATNNYELLHSDLLGELHDPAWQMKLVKRLSPNSNPDITQPEEYWGGNANEQYRYNK